MGRSSQETGAYLVGKVDNLRVYTSVLSEEALKELALNTGEHTPVSASAVVVATKIGVAPVLPDTVTMRYADGTYMDAAVVWEPVPEESYSTKGEFTVNGTAENIAVTATVYVVPGDKMQMEQLPGVVQDSIEGETLRESPANVLITRDEPASSKDFTSNSSTKGGWINWGYPSQDTDAWVAYTWDEAKILCESDAYFYKDNNSNFFPAEYVVEYLDEDGKTWLPVENTSTYVVTENGYSHLEFQPVVTTSIRLTMSPAMQGSGILKWKVWGFDSALHPNTEALKLLINNTQILQGKLAEGLVIDPNGQLEQAISAAKDKLEQINAIEIEDEATLATVQEQVDAAHEALAAVVGGLQGKDGNQAYLAQTGTSFVSSWESLDAVNDGIINLGPDPAKPRYGTWGNTSPYETITYTWAVPQKLTKTSIQFWTDNGGILPPDGYELYWLDQDGNYQLLTEIQGQPAMDTMLETTFDTVTTAGLQIRIHKQAADANGIGVMEWSVFGPDGGSTDDGSTGSGSTGEPSTGEKTETITNPDGSTTTIVTRPDGSRTETTKAPDGSSSVVNIDPNGQVQADVTISSDAVSNADGAVKLPMPEVSATTDAEKAPSITVDLPTDAPVRVEVPVANATAGTVAVLVKDDGSLEILKTTIPTETGVAVTLSDGDTIRIVDNSKTFVDVPADFWGAEAVTFVSSRELFNGTSETEFSPNGDMTRAMFVTVLARLEGVDTTAGDTWYAAGQKWAMEQGISDGSNMMGSLTREQLATMLYRYAGSPASGGTIDTFQDAADVSEWAQNAMKWAIDAGIIAGSNGMLNPQGNATRAQVATMLMRFIKNEN